MGLLSKHKLRQTKIVQQQSLKRGLEMYFSLLDVALGPLPLDATKKKNKKKNRNVFLMTPSMHFSPVFIFFMNLSVTNLGSVTMETSIKIYLMRCQNEAKIPFY